MLSEDAEQKMPQPEGKASKSDHDERIIVRSFSKIVVYYPTMLTAFACGLICWFFPATDPAAAEFARNIQISEIMGEIFMIVFFFNTIVLAFEFPRLTAVAAFLLVLALVLGLVLADRYLSLIAPLKALHDYIHIAANASFYWFIAGILLFVYVVTWIISRFECWEITPNELLHHHGPFGDLERYPAPSIKFDKEIPDIFEFILLRSGRLVFYPTSERRAIVLDNVVGVTSVEKKIKHLLSAMEVRVDKDEVR